MFFKKRTATVPPTYYTVRVHVAGPITDDRVIDFFPGDKLQFRRNDDEIATLRFSQWGTRGVSAENVLKPE